MTKPAPLEELAPTATRFRAAAGQIAMRSTIGGFLAGAAIMSLLWWSSRRSGAADVAHPESGQAFRVSYMVETGPGHAEGGTLDAVEAIEFHPAYVVVRRGDGSGGVFFTQRTRSFSWSSQPIPASTPGGGGTTTIR